MGSGLQVEECGIGWWLEESSEIFYGSYNQRMKDQELYDLIKQAVR